MKSITLHVLVIRNKLYSLFTLLFEVILFSCLTGLRQPIHFTCTFSGQTLLCFYNNNNNIYLNKSYLNKSCSLTLSTSLFSFRYLMGILYRIKCNGLFFKPYKLLH